MEEFEALRQQGVLERHKMTGWSYDLTEEDKEELSKYWIDEEAELTEEWLEGFRLCLSSISIGGLNANGDDHRRKSD